MRSMGVLYIVMLRTHDWVSWQVSGVFARASLAYAQWQARRQQLQLQNQPY